MLRASFSIKTLCVEITVISITLIVL